MTLPVYHDPTHTTLPVYHADTFAKENVIIRIIYDFV